MLTDLPKDAWRTFWIWHVKKVGSEKCGWEVASLVSLDGLAEYLLAVFSGQTKYRESHRAPTSGKGKLRKNSIRAKHRCDLHGPPQKTGALWIPSMLFFWSVFALVAERMCREPIAES